VFFVMGYEDEIVLAFGLFLSDLLMDMLLLYQRKKEREGTNGKRQTFKCETAMARNRCLSPMKRNKNKHVLGEIQSLMSSCRRCGKMRQVNQMAL